MIKMNSGTSNWVLVLSILMCIVTSSNEKAVPEDSITGYEYTYNNKNGQYEVRPLYGKISLTSTTKPDHYYNPQTGDLENNGEPIFLPPIGKSKSEMNKILKDYRSKPNLKLIKGMEVSRDYSNNLDFTQNWTPEYFTNDGYDNGYFESPVITSSKNSNHEKFQNKESCKNCHGESTDEKSERYKVQPSVEYEDNSKVHQSNLNSGMDRFRIKGDKATYSQNIQSAVSTDYPDKQTYDFEEVKVVNKIKYNDISTLSEIETISEKSGVKYYAPAIRQVSSQRKSGSKGKHKKMKKYQNYGDFEVKLVNSGKSVKPANKHPVPASTTIHATNYPESKETKKNTLLEKRKGYAEEAIQERSEQSEDHVLEHFTKVKDTNLSSFTKKDKECKDINSKSNKNGNVKSCSENSISSEPEIESPKIVSIQTSDVKSPIMDYEYNTEKTIPEQKHSEDHEIEHYTKQKDGHLSSFTKNDKECKEINSKSDKNGNVKSCSESSVSSEPEMEESPKVVSIKSVEKSPIIDEYDFKNKGQESNLKDFSVIEDSSKGIDLIDIEEMHGDFRRDISDECNCKFIEPINSGDMAANQLDGQCPESDVSDKITPDVPNFSDVDNKFKSFSRLNSNLWSLISNPNAKDLSLQKCITRKNETGHCMYIQNCPVPNIANSLEQLLNNACVMDEVFIGICCPEFPVETVGVQWEHHSSDKQTEDEFRHDVEDCGKISKEASKKNLWPWKAPLISMSNGKIFCGGVIISERYVLTAAHCTTKIAKNQILVRLGQDDESLGEDIPVIEIKRHAQYNPRTLQHDIALLKLGKRLSHAVESTRMICLPDDSDDTDSHSGDTAILLGWQGLSGVKPQKAETLEILSNEECQKKLKTNFHKSLLCTEVRNVDERTCNADSGSPLVIEDDDEEYEVIGILSWNRNDCDQRFPSTFSRVSSYREWIRRHAV